MALQSSGAIKISEINTENAATTSNSLKTLSETAIEGLSTLNESPFAMSEFYGYTHVVDEFGTMFDLPNNAMVESGGSNSGNANVTAMSLAYIAFAYQPLDNRIRIKQGTGTNSVAVSFNYYNVTYTAGSDPENMQVKLTWSGSDDTSNFNTGTVTESAGVAANTYHTIAKQSSSSSDTGSFFATSWQVSKSSQNNIGNITYDAGVFSGTGLVTRFQAIDSNGNQLFESANSNAEPIYVRATRSGGGGGGFGPICIHEDMKIHTNLGLLTIDEVEEKDPKIYSYNKDTLKIEALDLEALRIVEHDNLYKINDIMLTEDHIMYAEDYTPVSVNPELAKKNYGKESRKIQLNDRIMKYDGGVEKVISIEKYEGMHRTYTIKTSLGNFFADSYLVDSEI